MTAAETPFRCFPLLHGMMSGSTGESEGRKERRRKARKKKKKKKRRDEKWMTEKRNTNNPYL